MIKRSLDAQYCVDSHQVQGGPAVEPLNAMLSKSRKIYENDAAWLGGVKEQIESSLKMLEKRFAAI